MKITQKEIESVSKLAPFDRYTYFIKRVADFEKMYTIVDKAGYLAISEIDAKLLISLWSSQEYATLNITGEWEQYVVKEITLEEFEISYIDLIVENNYLINVFPVNSKAGFVVDVNEFARDISDEMQKYS
ncbi:DUF2750 domain-containing protein [Emticicia sp. TH156]|uniref:DUF2750 domain-containing protein n=1 Tax=Emticicia sp. TH156 TaxID=2067454 RepID=UPI000C78E072|nr:DUF2750 domain-containing protein [Emticicia sp. TH156]PLK42111.1 DUF2750 domain-containing protein [Emticicia sp. TH156]